MNTHSTDRESWPLMICGNCGQGQTFAGSKVKQGRARGICDRCGGQRKWKIASAYGKLPGYKAL